MATGSFDKTIIIWDVKTWKPTSQPLKGHRSAVTNVAFSGDGKWLATGSWDQTIILWDVSNSTPIPRKLLKGHSHSIKSVAFNPTNSEQLVSMDENNTVIMWNIGSQTAIGPLQKEQKKQNDLTYGVVDFSSDGKLLWDVKTQMLIGPLKIKNQNVKSLAFGSDNKQLIGATISKPNKIILWDVKTQTPISFFNHEKVTEIAFSSDGKLLVSTNNKDIILWDIETKTSIGPPRKIMSGQSFLNISPDGKFIALSDRYKKVVILWNLKNWTRVGVVPLKIDNYYDIYVVFGPNNRRLASIDGNRMILWDADTGIPFEVFNMHYRGNRVAFSPNGKHIVTYYETYNGDYKDYMIWDVDPQSWAEIACYKAGRNLTQNEWNFYLPNEPYQKTCVQYPEGK